MIDNIAVGKNIARLRQTKGMTQQQLAAALSVSHQAVSKWETGAALPDVQTLLSLTQLFGVTMEQLLNDEIPEDRFDNEPKPAEEAPRPLSPIEGALRDIGNFVNGIFKPAEKKEAEPEPEAEEQPEEEPAGEADPEPAEAEEDFDLERLLQMAPFMSKEALDELMLAHRRQLSAADIARFAPFLSQDCLEKLILDCSQEISWDTLRRVAPFLKREMVDKLTKAAASGERFVRNTVKQGGKTAEDIGKAIGDVSQKIGGGVEKVIRKAADGVSSAFGCDKADAKRVADLRRAAYERALQDEKWEWLAEHIEEIRDEELLRAIAQKANNLGMHDWVLEHLNGFADTRTIDAAIEAGNWGWLGDHVWQFEDALQEKIALAAADAENWQWLSIYAEQIALDNCADTIGIAAYRADARVLARQLAERSMSAAQREALADAAVLAEDYEFVGQLADLLSAEYFGRLCLARAQEKNWERAREFIARADHGSLLQMMELAIAEGNFDAIDLIDPLL